MIQIDSVSYDSTSQQLTIYVRNLGSTAVEIDEIYIYKSDGTLVTNIDLDQNVAIDPNSVGTITLNSESALNPGTYSYYVKVVTTTTSRG